MHNPQDTLRQFAERATRYAVNLDGQVCRSTYAILGGGNAIVYRGTLKSDGTMVAVKTVRGSPPSDSNTIMHVLREVHVCSKLHHKNVISVLGITTEFDQTVSIVSPWMENGDAHKYVQKMAIDPRPLMLGIARGLQYLHTRRDGAVFHGDLKGPNVLISDDGRALLADFDLSLLVDSTFSMSVAGKAGLSINWAAPEILDDRPKSAEADVWSFGMTLLELFTRKKPFYQCGINAVVGKICQGKTPDRPSNEETCWRLTDEWWDICRRCWNYDPPSRPTITHVLQAITNIQQSETPMPAVM